MKRQRSLFINVLYIIHKLRNHQLQMIVWRWKLIVTLNRNLFQNCCYMCLSENFIQSYTRYGGLKETRDEYDNNIISDSPLFSILPPQLKKMSSRYKVLCGCKYCIFSKSMHSLLLSWHDWYLKRSRTSAKILKKEDLGKK